MSVEILEGAFPKPLCTKIDMVKKEEN